jgi:two-component system response regulator FlrC
MSAAHGVVVTLDSGIQPLREIRSAQSKAKSSGPIIVRVDRENFELGILAMRHGATTVVPTQNLNPKDWMEVFSVARVTPVEDTSGFIFADPVSRNLLALAERVAKVDVTVLLEGPTGSGKEVVSRILHEASPRHSGPFIAFNCAAMPENLIEDMLFGHDKGSFTGASNCQPGLFEQAEGGTIFLDEIGEMPYHLQAKLLRILQERTVTRLGGQKSIDLDIRVIAATNRSLKSAIYERTFREDLYFRLSAFKITLPSLSQRPLDILPLAQQFINQQAPVDSQMSLTTDAERSLIAYRWPGNVRELQNVIIRAVVLAQSDCIDIDHLVFDDIEEAQADYSHTTFSPSTALIKNHSWPQKATDNQPKQLSNAIQDSEYETIMAALQRSRNRDQAAEVLGISTRTLRHKLQRLREQGMSVTRAYAR